MDSILKRILEKKEEEVENYRNKGIPALEVFRQPKSLIKVLNNSKEIAVIAEFKRASPSKGLINGIPHPGEQAKLYEQAGATAISVLTDSTFFKGSFRDLEEVKSSVGLPVLCKDFIIDEIQIDLAYRAGADLILLIAAALEAERLRELYLYARSLGLEVLVEVHQEKELNDALMTGAQLIGVNNRNLRTFKVSMENTANLGPKVREAGAMFISESGFKGREDALLAAQAGADALLIGETLMTTDSLKKKTAEFIVSKPEVLTK
ncbi:Indole-3-glycerol-phosphate synthase, phosphoribosylanthranilate isomerase [Bacillus sp. B-jedd]|nr:indole-3-glycerol phosphate synthase TrpC [Bacillus sp. B-jedd]CEG27500.1 Indole-3-glycerol-phosphate synthase, phosphoribosylanthranilate isomerase [Bacillus sp. B-jedd]